MNARLTAAERESQDDLDYVTLRLEEALSEGPKSCFDVDLEVPGSEKQQYRAADRLGVIKSKGGYDNSWYWMLPKHLPQWRAKEEKRKEKQKHAHNDRKKRRRRARAADGATVAS